jgi:hypothetical protein
MNKLRILLEFHESGIHLNMPFSFTLLEFPACPLSLRSSWRGSRKFEFREGYFSVLVDVYVGEGL